MIEQIYTFFTIEMTYLCLNLGILPLVTSQSDKKSIDKMIQKAIAADSARQKKELKKEFQKMIDSELKSKAVKELVSDIVAKEISSDKGKNKVADITKLVLRKLYRELAYNYTPVIDRIKI